MIRYRFKPGDPHRWVRCQRCSTAFCWAWYGQWLKIKNSFNSEFKIELGISTLGQTVELSGHASGSETLQPLRIYRISSNFIESCLLSCAGILYTQNVSAKVKVKTKVVPRVVCKIYKRDLPWIIHLSFLLFCSWTSWLFLGLSDLHVSSSWPSP